MCLEKIFSDNSFFHFGISVPDIDLWLVPLEALFQTKVVSRRMVSHDYLGTLVGDKGAQAEIAMLEFSEGQFIELLKWSPTHDSIANIPNLLTHIGTTHLCIYVADSQEVFSRSRSIDYVELLSETVSIIPTGPNKGASVFFIRIHKKLYIEVFQKPF